MNTETQRKLKIISLFVFFAVIFVYALFRSSDLIVGVKIKNVNLIDGAKVTESIMHINGNAKNATNLTLNGRGISVDQAGNFDETIALLLGYNVVNITALDKFGHRDEKNYKLIYEKLP